MPDPFVVPAYCIPVASLKISTSASTMGFPAGSTTNPLMVAFVNCAEAAETDSKSNPGRHRAKRRYKAELLAWRGMFRHPVYAGSIFGLPIISGIVQTRRQLRLRDGATTTPIPFTQELPLS